MAQYSADENGRVGKWHLMHLGNLAVSGAGLVMIEATAVEPRGRISLACPGLWSGDQVRGLQEVTEFCHAHGGARLGIQLAHSGRKGSARAPWEKQAQILPADGGWTPVSSSARPFPGRAQPHSLSLEELEELKTLYAAAARHANEADIDLVELHCAHGYLLHSFLSPLVNDRKDRYGGDLEARMRFPLEVFQAVRDAWPASKAAGVRISATDWIGGGWSVEESIVFAQRLKALGCAYVSVSSGGVDPSQRIPVGPLYQVLLSETIRHGAGIATVAAGIITKAAEAEAILADGKADLVALGRGMTYESRWAWHAAAEFQAPVFFPKQYARSHPSMRFGDFYKVYEESNR